MNTIKDAVGKFMRNDIRREAGEYGSSWKIGTINVISCLKITKKDSLFIGSVLCVGSPECMRI